MPFGKILLSAFLLLPLAELAGFVLVAWNIGVLRALGLLLLAGVAGVLLLRHAGRSQIARLQAALASGRVDEMQIKGAGLVYVAVGLLLLVPGFLTDIAALLLLVPAVRRLLGAAFGRAIVAQRTRAGSRSGPAVVDLEQEEWRRLPEAELPPPRPPGEPRGPARDREDRS
jgi:UPF0716 protein FxsA